MALRGTALLPGAGTEREASETRAGQSLPQRVQGMGMLGKQKLHPLFLLGWKLGLLPEKLPLIPTESLGTPWERLLISSLCFVTALLNFNPITLMETVQGTKLFSS